MKQNVKVKGGKSGLIVQLSAEPTFEELKKELAVKFKESADFFKDAKMALTFQGRKLTEEEEEELAEVIRANSSVRIAVMMHEDDFAEKAAEAAGAAEDTAEAKDPARTQIVTESIRVHDGTIKDSLFYKGTLRSGQLLESQNSIIVLGDVNTGATVVSGGNVIVLGALKGNVHVGAPENDNAFVAALEMDPMQVRIGTKIARSSDRAFTPKKKRRFEKKQIAVPKIAYVDGGDIYIETITKESLNDIKL